MRCRYFVALFLIALAMPALADDQQKAEKQIRMMTAMSRDDTARSIISCTFASEFKMERPQLVVQRKFLGLNYGGLFLAHELALSGTPMERIAEQLHSRQSIMDIASAIRPDWKSIASDAKKMNSRINDAIYKHFLHSTPDEQRDVVEHYNPSADYVRADADATPEEILKAANEYRFWRNQAAAINHGKADPNTAMGKAYEQARQDIEDTHGNTASTRTDH